ncbi:MAG: YihY/virulence factor BrkB family protein [Lapillicoccus sp.]
MRLRSRVRRELGRVQGATTAARLVLETVRACLRYRVTGLASEAAFFMLLSLPPLVLALFGGVGYLGGMVGSATVEEVTEAIRQYAARFLTTESISTVLLPTVNDVFRGGRFELVSVGFLLALWSGSRALNVFVDTIAIMYGQSGVRGIVRTRALSFSLYVTALLFGVVIVPLVLVGPTMLGGWLPDGARFLSALYWPVVAGATVAALTTLYHVATPHRGRWWRDAPGAVLALVIWVLASFVVRGTVGASLGGTSIYGPLSAPIVVLIWLYALAIAVLVGAGLNSASRVLWPVATHTGQTARLVEWARSEVERRRSGIADGVDGVDEDEQSRALADLMAYEQQFLDLSWEASSRTSPTEVRRGRKAS